MRAVFLLGVLILARALGMGGRDFAWTPWLPIALIWHDVACALGFGLIDRLSGRHPLMWIPYGGVVFLAGVNVGVVRALSSPLTWPMLGATGGALTDSVLHYATAGTLSAIGLVLVAGAIGAWRVTWRAAQRAPTPTEGATQRLGIA